MNDKQIACFLNTAKHLSFSRAAKALFLTQPAVTHQISSLEEELGFALFERRYRAITFTPAGKRFYEGMKDLVGGMQTLLEECRGIAQREDCDLTLGHFSPEGDNIFYQAMYGFTSMHPELRTDIRLPAPDSLLEHLCTHSLDAVVMPQHTLNGQEDLCTVVLRRNPEYCIMSRLHPLASRETVSLEDLKGEVCLVPKEQRCGCRPWHEHHLLKDGQCIIRMQNSLREQMTNLRTQPSVMVSLYPMLFIDNDLVRIPFSDGPSVTTVLAWMPDNDKPALKSLIEFLPGCYQ